MTRYQFLQNKKLLSDLLKNKYFFEVRANEVYIADLIIEVIPKKILFDIKRKEDIDLYDLLRHSYEFLVNRFQPEIILYKGMDTNVKEELTKLRFYPKGKQLQRITDPYRLLCKKNTFDEEGFIINQNYTDCIPFGLFSSREKGCGWIAAYNFLHMNKINAEIYEVTSQLSAKDFFFSFFGEFVFFLYDYLKKQVPVCFITSYEKDICRKMKNSNNGILLYYHKTGAHYTAFRKYDNNRYQFINAVYGRKILATAEEFMKKYTVLHFGTLIYSEK